MTLREYMFQRFIRNNHPKYHKYVNDWLQNTTKNQQNYFKEEQKRLGLCD